MEAVHMSALDLTPPSLQNPELAIQLKQMLDSIKDAVQQALPRVELAAQFNPSLADLAATLAQLNKTGSKSSAVACTHNLPAPSLSSGLAAVVSAAPTAAFGSLLTSVVSGSSSVIPPSVQELDGEPAAKRPRMHDHPPGSPPHCPASARGSPHSLARLLDSTLPSIPPGQPDGAACIDSQLGNAAAAATVAIPTNAGCHQLAVRPIPLATRWPVRHLMESEGHADTGAYDNHVATATLAGAAPAAFALAQDSPCFPSPHSGVGRIPVRGLGDGGGFAAPLRLSAAIATATAAVSSASAEAMQCRDGPVLYQGCAHTADSVNDRPAEVLQAPASPTWEDAQLLLSTAEAVAVRLWGDMQPRMGHEGSTGGDATPRRINSARGQDGGGSSRGAPGSPAVRDGPLVVAAHVEPCAATSETDTSDTADACSPPAAAHAAARCVRRRRGPSPAAAAAAAAAAVVTVGAIADGVAGIQPATFDAANMMRESVTSIAAAAPAPAAVFAAVADARAAIATTRVASSAAASPPQVSPAAAPPQHDGTQSAEVDGGSNPEDQEGGMESSDGEYPDFLPGPVIVGVPVPQAVSAANNGATGDDEGGAGVGAGSQSGTGTGKAGGSAGAGASLVLAPQLAVFDTRRYWRRKDCIRLLNDQPSAVWISRSQFEKLCGSTTAKWYRSIRVLGPAGPDSAALSRLPTASPSCSFPDPPSTCAAAGQALPQPSSLLLPDHSHLQDLSQVAPASLEPIGDWLQRQGLPIWKGPNRLPPSCPASGRHRTKRAPRPGHPHPNGGINRGRSAPRASLGAAAAAAAAALMAAEEAARAPAGSSVCASAAASARAAAAAAAAVVRAVTAESAGGGGEGGSADDSALEALQGSVPTPGRGAVAPVAGNSGQKGAIVAQVRAGDGDVRRSPDSRADGGPLLPTARVSDVEPQLQPQPQAAAVVERREGQALPQPLAVPVAPGCAAVLASAVQATVGAPPADIVNPAASSHSSEGLGGGGCDPRSAVGEAVGDAVAAGAGPQDGDEGGTEGPAHSGLCSSNTDRSHHQQDGGERTSSGSYGGERSGRGGGSQGKVATMAGAAAATGSDAPAEARLPPRKRRLAVVPPAAEAGTAAEPSPALSAEAATSDEATTTGTAPEPKRRAIGALAAGPSGAGADGAAAAAAGQDRPNDGGRAWLQYPPAQRALTRIPVYEAYPAPGAVPWRRPPAPVLMARAAVGPPPPPSPPGALSQGVLRPLPTAAMAMRRHRARSDGSLSHPHPGASHQQLYPTSHQQLPHPFSVHPRGPAFVQPQQPAGPRARSPPAGADTAEGPGPRGGGWVAPVPGFGAGFPQRPVRPMVRQQVVTVTYLQPYSPRFTESC